MDVTEIAGYQVLGPLGEGGMGQVFLVEHPRLPRRDALKLLDAGVSRNEDFKNRFHREADVLAQLSHPNIVTLHDRGEYDGRLWITMEYVDGTDGGRLLESAGPLPVDLAVQLVAGAGSALDYAWRKQQITHRDVKPANILVALDDADDEMTVESVKLADFGIAKAAGEATSLTSTGITVGTMAYISPEAIEGHVLDNRSDIYSLGCTAFHLITGQAPFAGRTMASLMSAHLNHPAPAVTEINPELPSALNPVFAKVLAKNPDDRFQTCAEFVAALDDATRGIAPTLASPAFAPTMTAPTMARNTAATTERPNTRRWLLAGVVVAAIAALGAIGAAGYVYTQSDNSTPAALAPSTSSPATTTAPPTITTTTTTVVEAPVQTPEEPVVVETPVAPEPVEGQPCGVEQFGEQSSDGTLYCSAMNGAWSDRTHQDRPAVSRGQSCSEPGARARIAQTDAVATCSTGPDGALSWNLQ
ncbi:serine/threonine-protein kinase [Gordonia sp. (in: high G+C Gram-positive bacteria)]|uniref:serine/threonine-protein kinase n=1 Tax=Gordonia sp. (in: high G+C Gram-positive bacteria) TaxID=84139 RepID=UPI003C78A077